MPNLLDIQHFSKTYKSSAKRAVDDLSLTVAPGEIHGFIGQNGAGKTTTIRAAVGVMDFSEGEIFIDGHSIKKEPVLCKQRLAYVPDNPDLYDYLTGVQYLSYMADVFRVSDADRKKRIAHYSELLGLSDDLGGLIGGYSHGMKQKLALIGAFIHAPKLLVLDEPFVGLDPEAAYHLKAMMQSLCDAGGAIFFSTHVLEVAEKLCHTISIIKAGKLVVSGKTDVLRGDKSLESLFLEVMDHDA
ncbi:MAG: ABC transporter ATP-binding protein [Eubacterium sp.]|nr:ABC transporter ATP-binding protein [Eubacterium sp.]